MYGYKEAEEERKRKAAVKNDPTAAGRSAIRRQSTIRRRDNPVTERRNGHVSPRAVRLSLSNYVVDDRDGEFVIAPRPRPRPSETLPSWNDPSRRTYRAEVEEQSHLLPMEDGPVTTQRHTARTRDYTSGARFSAIPPPRESYLRNEIRHDDEIYEIDRAISERAAAIAHPEGDWVERNRRYWHDRYRNSSRRLSPPPAQSDRFAPAWRFERPPTGPQPTWARSADRRSRSPRQQHLDDISQTSSPVALSPNFPPLERTMTRGSTVEARASTPRHDISAADGLGDRRRSPSPSDDAWETLITTIANDERLPSAESSFTSATAASSFSNTVGSQPATSATSPSLANGPGTSLHRDRDCDEPDAGMQTPDSLPDLIQMNRSASSSVRPDHVHREGPVLSSGSREDFMEEARREIQREIDSYSRIQEIVDSFHRQGVNPPDDLWQIFGLRNALAGAADVGSTEDRDSL